MENILTIYKHELKFKDGPQPIQMMAESRIMNAREQHGRICFWSAHDTRQINQEFRTFMVVPTGQEFKIEAGHRMVYIGTVLLDGGSLVAHVAEIIPIDIKTGKVIHDMIDPGAKE